MATPKDVSIHKWNQVIRGHNYFFVDFIMTSKMLNLDSFGLVIKYFKLNIDFLVKFLIKIQENFA